MRNRTASLLETDTLVWTNGTGAAVNPLDALGKEGVVKIQRRYAIAMVAIAAAASGVVQTKGRFKLCKDNGVAYAQGDRLGWDSANKKVTTDTSAGTLGRVVTAAVNADTLVEVEIDSFELSPLALVNAVGAASTVIANTNVETAFDKTVTIPANTLRIGDVVEIEGFVNVGAANSTDTLTLKLKINNQVLATTAAVDPTNGGGDTGYFRAVLTIRSIGAGGTFVASGFWALGVPGTATLRPIVLTSTAIDTTVDQVVKATATWSVTNAGDQADLEQLNVKVLRAA